MIPFYQYCEAFNLFDSRYAKGVTGAAPGSGRSVSSADIMKSPSQVSTPIMGDITGFSGMDQIKMRGKKPAFAYKIKKTRSNGKPIFTIQIGLKGHMDYTDVSKTAFAQYIDDDTFDIEKHAQEVLARLKASIESVEVDSRK